MHRSFDSEVLRRAAEPYPDIVPHAFDFPAWVSNLNNVMIVEGEDVGFFTYEYPGVYNAHYFMVTRGRGVIPIANQAFEMMFNNYGAETLRGLTKKSLRAACWMARQIGFKSYGSIVYPEKDGEYELFFVTKNEFREHMNMKRKI